MVEKVSHSTEDTERIGRELARQFKPGTVVALKGTLGSGKSVLTRGIARELGISEPVTSPTYTIVSEYHQGRLPFYHMDLYRIHSSDEFELFGGHELLFGQGVTVVEWYEIIEDILPEKAIKVAIEIMENQDRMIVMDIKE